MEQEYFKGDTFLSTKDKKTTITVLDVVKESNDFFYTIKIMKQDKYIDLEKNILNAEDFKKLLDFNLTILISSGIK